MMTAAILGDTKLLGWYLTRLQVHRRRKYKFILLGERDVRAAVLLKQKGFQEIHPFEPDQSYRNRFLQEYIDLVGRLGREHSTRKWWATDMASKNRFASRLSYLLHQFMMVIEGINGEECDHLLIINPSWVLSDSLQKALQENGIRTACLECHFKKWVGIVGAWCRIVALSLYDALIASARKNYVQRKLGHMLSNLSTSRSFYIIKTFVYDHSFTREGIYRDSFFGSLPEFLRGKRDVLIYANILGNYKLCIKKIAGCPSPPIVPIEGFLTYTDILQALVQSLFCRLRFRKEVSFFGCDVSCLVNNELFRTLNGASFYQLLHYWSTTKLLKTVSTETFLLTYENNPWEKMCILALRERDPNTTVIGYQHTVVPQASANMFMSRNEREIMPKPDRILTVGEVPKEIMERYGHYENGQIEPSCGLRFEYLSQATMNSRKDIRNVLVVLEGIFEVYKMVNYVLKELKEQAHYQVIIRTHPVLPLRRFEHKLIQDVRSIPNFSISRNASLKEDIEWADLVIYWGSTVALEALSTGKPVIHYEMDSILSYDPLFECDHLKWVISDKEPVMLTLQEIGSLRDEQFLTEQRNAKAYLNRYFLPVTQQRLSKFLVARQN